MILPFSTKINGKPTYFVEKILRGIINEYAGKVTAIADYIYSSAEALNYQYVDEIFDIIEHRVKPKLHTIREDKKDRWKVGTKIDFFINARQKNMFRFAPVLPVVSVQKVFMTYAFNDVIEISVNDKYITDVLAFAKNDGFDKWEDFFNFFYPKIMENPEQFYKAKLIHWTDFKY